MKLNRGVLIELAAPFWLAQPCASQVPKASLVPNDSAIRQILVDRIDKHRQSVGIVVGVIDAKGRRVVAHGERDQGDPAALNGDTVLEVGSITKVFTALLLADMVQRGEVTLDDPVAKHLPTRVPERGGRQITLRDLATHTSGLPRDPSNMSPRETQRTPVLSEAIPNVRYIQSSSHSRDRPQNITRPGCPDYSVSRTCRSRARNSSLNPRSTASVTSPAASMPLTCTRSLSR